MFISCTVLVRFRCNFRISRYLCTLSRNLYYRRCLLFCFVLLIFSHDVISAWCLHYLVLCSLVCSLLFIKIKLSSSLQSYSYQDITSPCSLEIWFCWLYNQISKLAVFHRRSNTNYHCGISASVRSVFRLGYQHFLSL